MEGEDCLQFSIRLERMTDDLLPFEMDLPAGWTADGEAVAANVMEFGRVLRRAGLDVDPGQTTTFVRALTLLGLDDRRDVRVAGRTIFVRRSEDQPIYDAAFDLFWRRPAASSRLSGQLPRIRQSEDRGTLSGAPSQPDAPASKESVATARPRTASARELLRTADFAALTPDESRDAQAMLVALRLRLATRRGRRSRLKRSGHRPAARFMLRRALAAGGEALRWRWLRRVRRPRPIVLICDISGSMERYSRFMLRFAHALRRSGAPVEVFVFATRLTRITRQLELRTADAALRRVAERVVDWSGGTRIGECLRELNQRWVRRTVRSGAVVLLVSDGWERGDPALLAREMATLQRSCYRLIWLDPLASRPGFEPATLGLRAALPYIDDLVPCASVVSLTEMAERLASL
jgi:uncharacterized protein with von Willebrand factor type A (vWA) domain